MTAYRGRCKLVSSLVFILCVGGGGDACLVHNPTDLPASPAGVVSGEGEGSLYVERRCLRHTSQDR